MKYFFKIVSLVLLSVPLSALAFENESPWALSHQLEAKGKYQQAAALIEPFVDAGGNTAEYALLRYGWLNYLLRNYSDSVRSYEKALSLNPESVDARLGLTLPLLAQEKWKESALYAKQILKRAPWHFTAHVRLLISEEGQRNWSAMKNHASLLAAHYPSSATPWVYLARAEAWQGDYEAAQRAYLRVLRRFPSHIEANAFIQKNGK